MPKKGSKTHLFDVLTVDKPKNNAWEITEEVAENVNLLRSLVQIVAKRTLFLSNHEVTDQFCAEIVSSLNDKAKKSADFSA